MVQEITTNRALTPRLAGLSPAQTEAMSRAKKAIAALSQSTSPRAALEAAQRLIGQWPHARPADPETYAAALGAVLAGYPLGVVMECSDPRVGLARSREFPPTVAAVVEWCDARLTYHRNWAAYVPPKLTRDDGREFPPEHRLNMIERLQAVMRGLLRAERQERREAAE